MSEGADAAAIVLDASALLVAMLDEDGAGRVQMVLDRACIGTVNLSEVVAKLADRGVPEPVLRELLAELDLDIRPFDAEQALGAGLLRPHTRGAGLSLGDRACLALARSLGATAMTADRAWADLDVGVEVAVIR